MFDNVKFEGTINLGALCVAVIQLLSAYAVLVRIRAMIEEKNIRLNIFNRKKILPASKPEPVEPPEQAIPDKSVDNPKVLK